MQVCLQLQAVNQLIDAAEVVSTLSTMVDTEHEIPILPQSERQARPLTQLQPNVAT